MFVLTCVSSLIVYGVFISVRFGVSLSVEVVALWILGLRR
jgi:hypothetical protein